MYLIQNLEKTLFELSRFKFWKPDKTIDKPKAKFQSKLKAPEQYLEKGKGVIGLWAVTKNFIVTVAERLCCTKSITKFTGFISINFESGFQYSGQPI